MRSALFCLALLASAGCGPSAPTGVNDSEDPEVYAKYVKQIVYNMSESVPRSGEPWAVIGNLVDELENPSRPQGNYAGIYQQLLTVAKEIQKDSQKAGGRPGNLGSRLAELKKIADGLPGEVKAFKSGRSGPND